MRCAPAGPPIGGPRPFALNPEGREAMYTLRIEHQVHDYAAWKGVFDADPADRRGSGVRRYRVSRSGPDGNQVHVDLDFDDVESADAMLGRLRPIWAGTGASVMVDPVGSVLEQVESVDLA